MGLILGLGLVFSWCLWGSPGSSTVRKHEHQVDLFQQEHPLCGWMMMMVAVLLMDGWMNGWMKAKTDDIV